MTRDEAKARLRGLFNISATPFGADDELDIEALTQNIERMFAYGLDGLLIGGTYGEFPAMSTSERARLFRGAVAAAGRRAVMLCAASADPRVTRELVELASQLGAPAMVTAPYVTEVTDEQIVAYFGALAPIARSGLVIYNAPGVGITLSPSLLEKLSDIEGVIGLKQGALDPTAVDQIANRLSGKIALFCASDLAFLGPVLAGFDGVSSTNSSALPETIVETWRSLSAGDAVRARNLHRSWYDYRAWARRLGQPQTVKAAMSLRGWNGGKVRPPLAPLGADETAMLDQALRKALSNVPMEAST